MCSLKPNISEGLINTTKGLYDSSENLIAAYPESWNVIGVNDFYEGYAPIKMKGADTKAYFSIVDKNGNRKFEPIKYDTFVASRGGYVITKLNNVEKAYDPTGKSISTTEAEKIINKGKRIKYNESKERYEGIQNTSGEIITSVCVVSNYDEIKDLPVTGTTSIESNSLTATTPNYITVSDFSITGKWKNVGSYTFGQVQSGAIVVFNGSNCNFFSPKDTYAFYKNGNHYKLDCTSLLADTLSFTVKIVDENNIHVYNGSNYLELKRVG